MKDVGKKRAKKPERIITCFKGWTHEEIAKTLKIPIEEVERLIKLHHSVDNDDKNKPTQEKPYSVRDTVIELNKLGWENFEIAKALKLPIEKVELFLERNQSD